MNLSLQTKGFLLIVAGLLLVIDYFAIIEKLHSLIAVCGVIMIIIGSFMAGIHTKLYRMITKSNNTTPDEEQKF